MPVYVKMVHSMTAAWGNDSTCVAEQRKQWNFGGDGLTANGETDLIKFVANDKNCENGSDATLAGADSDDVAMYLTTGAAAKFTIEPASAGKSLFLCYKFGNEKYQWYNMSMYVHMLQSVESRTGGTDIAVVEVLEVFVLHANGTSVQDSVRWVVSDDTTTDSACNDTVLDIWDNDQLEADPLSASPVYLALGTFRANFTFDSSSAGLSPTLCYKFAGSLYVVKESFLVWRAQGVRSAQPAHGAMSFCDITCALLRPSHQPLSSAHTHTQYSMHPSGSVCHSSSLVGVDSFQGRRTTHPATTHLLQ